MAALHDHKFSRNTNCISLAIACGLWALAGTATGIAAHEAPDLLHRLTMEEYEATLRHWRNLHPKWFTLESRGLSANSLPVYLAKITNSEVPDENKQVILVTALHSGPERLGATSTLALMEWLLGNEPLAKETRDKQIVLCLPVVNPMAMFFTDRFRNDRGSDPYTGLARLGRQWDIKTLSLLKPEDAPELAAVLSVMDQYQPEVHVDLHGTGLQEYAPEQLGSRRMYQGQMMTEVTGSAYSNFALRPWDWRVTETMIAAGNAAGFPSDRFEADAQRLFWGPDLAPLRGKLWNGMPLFYTAHYGYAKYHTMIMALEAAWEESAVARLQGMLRLGNTPWLDENVAGYPVNRVKSMLGSFVTAHGRTAADRRRSRVELWSRQEDFSLGFLYPQTVGRATLVCALTPEARAAVTAPDRPTLIAGLQAWFRDEGDFLAQYIDTGPEIKMVMEAKGSTPSEGCVPLKNGIGFRLRLPFRHLDHLEVRLNGELLQESRADGFEQWSADGFTQVQVHIPPTRAKDTALYFITCSYVPQEHRRQGWMPPQAVMEQCRTAKADASPPTFTDVAYGSHFRQTIDFWQARSPAPSPLLVYIHGGGWAAEDKSNIHQHLNIRRFLDAGISVAAVNYRFLQEAMAAGVTPPLEWPLQDTKRALQFLRTKAEDWHFDKRRVAATGVSAGACASLWLALHADMAEPNSPELLARESTRLLCVAASSPQTSLDPLVQKQWVPNSHYGGHAFGFPGKTRIEAFAPFLAGREAVLADIRRYSPIEHASADDPPVYMEFPHQDKPPVLGEVQTDPTHSAVHGLMLKQVLDALGVATVLSYPGASPTPYPSLESFLIQQLQPRSR